MRSRLFPGLPLAGLVLALSAPAPARAPVPDKKPESKPAVVVTLKSLDELIADARYLFALVDKEEEGKQLEKFLKSKTGPKGLEGVDPKKPIGLYGTLGTKGLADSHGVLLLPIADEKAFLKMLENLDLKPEKGKDGL